MKEHTRVVGSAIRKRLGTNYLFEQVRRIAINHDNLSWNQNMEFHVELDFLMSSSTCGAVYLSVFVFLLATSFFFDVFPPGKRSFYRYRYVAGGLVPSSAKD